MYQPVPLWFFGFASIRLGHTKRPAGILHILHDRYKFVRSGWLNQLGHKIFCHCSPGSAPIRVGLANDGKDADSCLGLYVLWLRVRKPNYIFLYCRPGPSPTR